jgi:hypothetical protein
MWKGKKRRKETRCKLGRGEVERDEGTEEEAG